jgi:putative phage-type endonuclease
MPPGFLQHKHKGSKHMEQLSQEWFDARKGKVTSSSIGAILGLDPNRNADDVLRAMVRDYHGAETEFTGNIATRWGQNNEDVARLKFINETGLDVEQCGFIANGWLGGSPDGLVGDSNIIEIKCPFGLRDKPAPVKFKPISEQPHYFAQMQYNMLFTGARGCWFVQWAPNGFSYELIEYEHGYIESTIDELIEFHDRYLSELNNPDHLADKRPEIDTLAAHQLVKEYDDLKDAEERAKERRQEVLEQIIALAGNKNATIAGRKLSEVERAGSIAYAKVVKEHLPKLDLEPYRGKSSSFWKLS